MDKETILKYVTETPGNTNSAVLKSMLNQMEGGDNPSDFSFAEVTLNLIPPEGAYPINRESAEECLIDYPISVDEALAEEGMAKTAYQCLRNSAVDHKVNVLLYKGVGYIHWVSAESDQPEGWGSYYKADPDMDGFSVSGNLAIDTINDLFYVVVVTGDGTITANLVKE